MNTEAEIESYVRRIDQMWKDTFKNTDVAMFPIQGNHDTWPVNVERFQKAEQNGPLSVYAELWKQFLTEEAYETFKEWGYYSMPMKL